MLILWFLSWIKAGFVRNAAGAGEDLRKLGLGMIGAGLFGVFSWSSAVEISYTCHTRDRVMGCRPIDVSPKPNTEE